MEFQLTFIVFIEMNSQLTYWHEIGINSDCYTQLYISFTFPLWNAKVNIYISDIEGQ